MHYLKRSLLALLVISFGIPAIASAATAAVQNLSSATPLAKTSVTFGMSVSGFSTPYYSVSDSFPNTSINSSNMNFGGNFQWTPNVSDIGTHNLIINVTDSDGHSAQVTQQIVVLPPPSITIQNVSHQTSIMPGTTYSFTVASPGFVNPTFSVGDSFGGSSANNAAISSSGSFSWKPDATQNGEHAITVYASDTQGHSAQATALIRVGSGPSLSVPTNVNTTVSQGQTISFSLSPLNFLPTGFSVSDKFSGQSSITNSAVNASGLFQWMPTLADAGQHTLTFTGQIGAYGQSASTSVVINVLNASGQMITPPAPSSNTASTSSSGASVSGLQAQLALLQAQLNGGSAQPTQSTVSVGSSFIFTLNLKQGSENDEVMELQKILKKLGYLAVEPNGYFGPSTVAAVKKFQAAKGLTQLGSVGPGTRLELNSLTSGGTTTTTSTTVTTSSAYVFEHFMGPGDDDYTDVFELQKKLVSLGFLSAAPNGFYGPATEAAVKKFQAKNGLTATGFVAKATRAALNSH